MTYENWKEENDDKRFKIGFLTCKRIYQIKKIESTVDDDLWCCGLVTLAGEWQIKNDGSSSTTVCICSLESENYSSCLLQDCLSYDVCRQKW